MANYPVPENPTYDASNIRQLEDTDAASASLTFNPLITNLLRNIHALKLLVDTISTALTGKAPESHASTATTYGRGSTTNYGHLKISDNYTSSAGAASAGVSASSKAVSDAYAAAVNLSNANGTLSVNNGGTGLSGSGYSSFTSPSGTYFVQILPGNRAMIYGKTRAATNGASASIPPTTTFLLLDQHRLMLNDTAFVYSNMQGNLWNSSSNTVPPLLSVWPKPVSANGYIDGVYFAVYLPETATGGNLDVSWMITGELFS